MNSYQNSFVFRIINGFFDICFTSLLWLVCSLPVVTIGAATTALNATMQHLCRDECSGVIRTFFTSFKRNFLQATVLWLGMIVFLFVLAMDIYSFIVLESIPAWFQVVPFFCGLVFVLTVPWLFSYLARYETSLGEALKRSLMFALRYLGWTALILLLFLAASLLGATVSVMLIFVPGIYTFCKAVIQRRIFDRYELN